MAGHYGSHPTLMFAAGQGIVKGLYSTRRDPKDIFNAQLIEVGNQKVSHFWLCLSLLDPIRSESASIVLITGSYSYIY